MTNLKELERQMRVIRETYEAEAATAEEYDRYMIRKMLKCKKERKIIMNFINPYANF